MINLEKINSVIEVIGGLNYKLRILIFDYLNIEDNINFVLYYVVFNMSLVVFEFINLINYKMLGVVGGEEKVVDFKVVIFNE